MLRPWSAYTGIGVGRSQWFGRLTPRKLLGFEDQSKKMQQRAGIFVLVDALGWEWVKATRFLEGIAPHRRALQTVLGYSAGAIPSILTGCTPAEHGRLAMYQR